MRIVSQRHRTKFYLSIILGSLFFIAIGTGVLYVFINSSSKGNLRPKEYFMPIFSLGVYLFAFYTVYRYFKNAPKIQVDNDLISFNKETFAWTDLKKIELTGKRSFQYLIDFPMEAATLQFNDGQIKYIFDDMYENSWEIKSFLKQVIIDKKTFIKTDNQSIDPVYINTDFYEIFKGNQFTSLRGISLWGLVGFFVYMILTNEKIPTFGLLVFFTIFSLFWFLGHSWLMHYFKVSTNILVVKNHNLTWRSKAYRLNDIKEIVFETQGKMPNCLRVITKDFRNKLYPAATLRNNTWLELKEKLQSLNIKVRNECI